MKSENETESDEMSVDSMIVDQFEWWRDVMGMWVPKKGVIIQECPKVSLIQIGEICQIYN